MTMENKKVCVYCGCVIEDEYDAVYCEGAYYCPDCADAHLTFCDRCEEWATEGERVYVTDGCRTEFWCDECISNYAIRCDICGDYYADGVGITARGGDDVCPDCAQGYSYCEECDQYVPDSEFNSDEGVCNECACTGESPLIKCYHGADKSRKFGLCSKRWRGVWRGIGIELEIDRDDSAGSEERECVDDLEALAHGHLTYERDGSLNYGFEIQTTPHTVDEFCKLNWRGIFDACTEHGYKSHDAGTCGLHIHVSRTMLGDDEETQQRAIAKLIRFFDLYYADIVKISRRDNYTASRWASPYHTSTNEEAQKYAKYTTREASHNMAVNLQHRETVEFRIMRGTLNIDTFLASVDFCVSIAKASRRIRWSDINDIKKWTRLCKPETLEYIRRRGAFTEVI